MNYHHAALNLRAAVRDSSDPAASFVLAHGRTWLGRARPAGIPPRPAGRCYPSTLDWCQQHHGWFYAEGFALYPDTGLPQLHAWAVGGTVVLDLTWPKPAPVYFGVPIPTADVEAEANRIGHYGYLRATQGGWHPTLPPGVRPTRQSGVSL